MFVEKCNLFLVNKIPIIGSSENIKQKPHHNMELLIFKDKISTPSPHPFSFLYIVLDNMFSNIYNGSINRYHWICFYLEGKTMVTDTKLSLKIIPVMTEINIALHSFVLEFMYLFIYFRETAGREKIGRETSICCL